jgi:nitrogen fixation NifU-like protein
MDNLYRQEILNHYQYPRNHQKPTNYSHSKSLSNAHCGDDITVYLEVKAKILKKIFYQVKGCAICVASSSILSEELRGKTVPEILKLSPVQVLRILKIKPTPTRAGCALLAFQAIKQAL